MKQWIILRSALAVTVGKGRISANLMAWQICLLRAGEHLLHCTSGRYQNTRLPSVASVVLTPTLKNVCAFFFFRNFLYFFLGAGLKRYCQLHDDGKYLLYCRAEKKAFVAQLPVCQTFCFTALYNNCTLPASRYRAAVWYKYSLIYMN